LGIEHLGVFTNRVWCAGLTQSIVEQVFDTLPTQEMSIVSRSFSSLDYFPVFIIENVIDLFQPERITESNRIIPRIGVQIDAAGQPDGILGEKAAGRWILNIRVRVSTSQRGVCKPSSRP
jgi:hypothetical protein